MADKRHTVTALGDIFRSPSDLESLSAVAESLQNSCAQLKRHVAARGVITPEYEQARSKAQDSVTQLQNLENFARKLQQSGSEAREQVSATTAGIERLDRAKDNLVRTITLLKRLQMLSNLHEQLEYLLKKRDYAELARAVDAANELSQFFKPYRAVSKVADLSRNLHNLQQRTADQIDSDVRKALLKNPTHNRHSSVASVDMASGLRASTPTLPKSELRDACIALEHLPGGDELRANLIGWYTSASLADYDRIFKASDEAGSLENIARRFVFLRRVVMQSDDALEVFPPSWQVQNNLGWLICSKTKRDIDILAKELGSNTASTAEDIQTLLTAVHETTEFEKWLARKTRNDEFNRSISTAFMPHLSLWVEYQSRQLNTRMKVYIANPVATMDGNGGEIEDSSAARLDLDVLPSSAELFIAYRHMLNQISQLSNGEPLLQLSRVFSRYLLQYAHNVLLSRISAAAEEGFQNVCTILRTATYCQSTVRQLEENIGELIDPKLLEKVSFEAALDGFAKIVSTCLSSLAAFINSSLDLSWREMANTNWSQANKGQVSTFVPPLLSSLEERASLILQSLPSAAHCRVVCDKCVEAICISFTSAMFKLRMPEVAAEQLLLDWKVISTELQTLLALAPSAKEKPERLTSFKTSTAGQTAKVEAVIKTLMTKADPAEQFVDTYFDLVQSRSISNFRRVMEAKGVKAGLARYIDLFESKSANRELQPESTLITLATKQPKVQQPVRPKAETLRQPAPVDVGNEIQNGVAKLNENFRRLWRRDGPTR